MGLAIAGSLYDDASGRRSVDTASRSRGAACGGVSSIAAAGGHAAWGTVSCLESQARENPDVRIGKSLGRPAAEERTLGWRVQASASHVASHYRRGSALGAEKTWQTREADDRKGLGGRQRPKRRGTKHTRGSHAGVGRAWCRGRGQRCPAVNGQRRTEAVSVNRRARAGDALDQSGHPHDDLEGHLPSWSSLLRGSKTTRFQMERDSCLH